MRNATSAVTHNLMRVTVSLSAELGRVRVASLTGGRVLEAALLLQFGEGLCLLELRGADGCSEDDEAVVLRVCGTMQHVYRKVRR